MIASAYTKSEQTRQAARRVRRTLWSAVMVLALIGIAVAVRRTVTIVPILVKGYTPPAPSSNPVAAQFAALDDLFARYAVLTLMHIIPGVLFMLLGPLQFSATIRARHLQWHRWSGRVYLLCSLIIGVSALAMSVGTPSIGGPTQAAATTLFALLCLFALGKAYWHVRHRKIAQHREWMIRAFAIGLAVATIRPIIGLFFATSRLSDLTPDMFFWQRLLDRLCAPRPCGRGMDSLDTTAAQVCCPIERCRPRTMRSMCGLDASRRSLERPV